MRCTMKEAIFWLVLILVLTCLLGSYILVINNESEEEKMDKELLLVTSKITDVNAIFCDFTRCEKPEEKQERYDQLSKLCTSQFLEKLKNLSSKYSINREFPNWEVVGWKVKIGKDRVPKVNVSENWPDKKCFYIISFKQEGSAFLLDNIEEVKNFYEHAIAGGEKHPPCFLIQQKMLKFKKIILSLNYEILLRCHSERVERPKNP